MGQGKDMEKGKTMEEKAEEGNLTDSAKHFPVNDSQNADNAKEEPITSLIPRPAREFPVQYRSNKKLTREDRNKIQQAVQDGGIALGLATYIDLDKLPILLDTDKPGALIIVDKAPEEEIIEIGEKTYLSTPETIKEQTKRMEQPRSALQQEKLRQARDNVEDFSTNRELQWERAIESDRIRKERPKIGKKALKDRSATKSELSGRPLDRDAEVHHLHRVADKPEKALDSDNMMVLKRDEHRDFHRSAYPPTPDSLREYAEEHREAWEAETKTREEVTETMEVETEMSCEG